MLDLFKKLFAPNPTAGDVWAVMEKMNSLLSFRKFQALKLTKRQRPRSGARRTTRSA